MALAFLLQQVSFLSPVVKSSQYNINNVVEEEGHRDGDSFCLPFIKHFAMYLTYGILINLHNTFMT